MPSVPAAASLFGRGRALKAHSDLSAAEIVRNALDIAGDICIYTNHDILVLELPGGRGDDATEPMDVVEAPPTSDASTEDAPAEAPWIDELTPRQIVEELDKYIVGQDDAKKAVADRSPQSVAPTAGRPTNSATRSCPTT